MWREIIRWRPTNPRFAVNRVTTRSAWTWIASWVKSRISSGSGRRRKRTWRLRWLPRRVKSARMWKPTRLVSGRCWRGVVAWVSSRSPRSCKAIFSPSHKHHLMWRREQAISKQSRFKIQYLRCPALSWTLFHF